MKFLFPQLSMNLSKRHRRHIQVYSYTFSDILAQGLNFFTQIGMMYIADLSFQALNQHAKKIISYGSFIMCLYGPLEFKDFYACSDMSCLKF